MNFKNWKHNWEPISADSDTVDYIMQNNEYEAKPPTESDLSSAATWLALYAVEYQNEHFQSLLNVIAYLEMSADQKRLQEAKKQFAKERGIKVSQVRIKKGA